MWPQPFRRWRFLFKFEQKTAQNGRLQRFPAARAALFRHQGVRGELLMGADPNFMTSRRREGARRYDGLGVACACFCSADLNLRASAGGVRLCGGAEAVPSQSGLYRYNNKALYYIYTILSSRCIYYLAVAVGLAVPATPLVAFCAVVRVVQLEVKHLYQLVILV